ncbi:helix-turn-helix domain-containing protein [Streptomyces sp. RFCAC02]|uniref:winged helix-turn-helix transcriptional regulator n=1 Tax=Streptomyces sp. RFCAC02 TaxID=2499143 RepID=UPI001021AE57|nr:helix-turn-helix domain-containing protein [Streptomyces sp. RFCAC02]
MTKRPYGQFCGLARALETVGERWTLLIVRDLLIGPKRFTDLRRGLPDIPTNVLSSRLKQLEENGIATRRALPHPERAVVYELTGHGRDLEPALIALGRWGATTMTEPRPGEVVTPDSLAMSFRTTFHPEAARGVRLTAEVRVPGITVGIEVTDGALAVSTEPLPDPGLIIEPLAGNPLLDLMTGALAPADAVTDGRIRLTGDTGLLEPFAVVFRF